MTKVLMPFHPKWVELILEGKKTLEIRKFVPKIRPPYEILMYETKQEGGSMGEEIRMEACLGETDSRYFCRGGGRTIKGMRVTDAERFDKPKHLYDFYAQYECEFTYQDFPNICLDCPFYDEGNSEEGIDQDCGFHPYGYHPILKAPQSFVYVEEGNL